MENVLYIIAVILVIGWVIGFVVYGATGVVHILLATGFLALVLRGIRMARL